MQFLGSLGVNSHLLIAQVINFALLVWLLSYFVYKPTIRIIERNEEELVEGSRQRELMEKEKNAFLAEKEKGIADIKAKNKKALMEMQFMSETIKDEGLERTLKDSAALVEQTRGTLELEKPMLEKKLAKDIRMEFGEKLRNSFKETILPGDRADFEKILFRSFIEGVKTEFPDADKHDPEFAQLRKLKKTRAGEYRKKIEQKFGTVVLEYAAVLTGQQRKEVENLIAKKTGLKIPLKVKRNERLVNGYRLEIAGMLVESNLSHIIHDAEKK